MDKILYDEFVDEQSKRIINIPQYEPFIKDKTGIEPKHLLKYIMDKYKDMVYVKPKNKSIIHKCKYCKSDNVDVKELQTRSADESATIFIFCNSCKKRSF